MDLHLSKNNFTAPIKNPETQHTMFEAVLLLLVIGLFYWFIVMPKKAELSNLQSQYAQLKQDQATLDSNKQKLANAIADIKNHPQEIAAMDEALPLNGRVSQLYLVLDQIAEQSGMTVGNIGISFPSDNYMAGNKDLLSNPYGAKRSLQKFSATLLVSGGMDRFQSLLQRIETSGRLLNITSVAVQPGSVSGTLDFTINLEAYYYE